MISEIAKEARDIVNNFDETREISSDEEFLFIEALEYLVDRENDPHDMMHLGGYYYGKKNFELALKYYEMAAALDFDPAYEGLGYIWYYGRTGKRDYEKAFYYFSRLADKGNAVAAYKVADMYKNGYGVEKNYARYCRIIEDLYVEAQKFNNVFDPVPEIYTRLARIRKKEGKIEDAVNLYLYAKNFLSQRIKYNPFFGNLNIMKWLIDDLYELIEFDEEYFDFYDLYYLLKTNVKITFEYENVRHTAYTELVDNQYAVCFDGKWFRSRDEFFDEASIGNVKLTSIYDKLYGYEVM